MLSACLQSCLSAHKLFEQSLQTRVLISNNLNSVEAFESVSTHVFSFPSCLTAFGSCAYNFDFIVVLAKNGKTKNKLAQNKLACSMPKISEYLLIWEIWK